MCKSLLGKFKEIYESNTDFKIVASNLDANGNLTVNVKKDNIEMWLHVEESNGEIIWW